MGNFQILSRLSTAVSIVRFHDTFDEWQL